MKKIFILLFVSLALFSCEKEENNNIMIRIMSNILGSRNSESREHILHIKTATEMMLDNW